MRTAALQPCIWRRADSPVSENLLVAVERLGYAQAFCLPPTCDRWNLSNKAPRLFHCVSIPCGSWFVWWDKHLLQWWILLASVGLVIWKKHWRQIAVTQEQTAALLTTKRWVFESNQSRFQWHLSLCVVKQTYKTPLAPLLPFWFTKVETFSMS